MQSLFCIVILSALAAFASGSHPVRIRRVEVTQPEEGHQSPYGTVKGVRQCGGPGKVVDFRVEGCTEESTCRVPSDGRVQSELEFIPSQDIDAIGIRLVLITDGTTNNVYERAIADSSVQGGEVYVVNAAGAPTKDLKGKTVTIQYLLYRVEDSDHVEVCAEADFEIY